MMNDENGWAGRIAEAVAALRSGRGILLTDDLSRENEGDLIFPAGTMTTADMALMIRHCSGIVCLCLTPERADALGLRPMVVHNTSRYGTNFTESIEAARGVTTGVSAADRVTTIRAAVREGAVPDDLSRPGHVFPLVARRGGVFERDGHTEGSVDLMRIAGLPPCAVLCELTNDDGTMARRPEIERFGSQHGFPVVSIDDIKRWRSSHNDAASGRS